MQTKEHARYRLIDESPPALADVMDFVGRLTTFENQSAGDFFASGTNIIITRAPGRLDVMGGIADYSGALVLQMPIAEATFVALQRDAAPVLRIVSGTASGKRRTPFVMSLDDLTDAAGAPISYKAARAFFQRDAAMQWAAYAAGAFLVLMRERGIRFKDGGARILITSGVPEGKGVSSSAALEVAVMSAIAAAYNLEIAPRELALLCQRVENYVVGAPCGVMDQMAVACGERDRLLALLCQPAELQNEIRIPDHLMIWGVDSGVRHSVGAGDYGSVRTGAFMGYRIIAEMAALPVSNDDAKGGRVHIVDERWHGYLANITPSEYEQHYARVLPETISGADFLARYQGMTDHATCVAPEKVYRVRQPTAHPIYENFRVRAFAELLLHAGAGESADQLLGELMYQSHASYSACELGSEGTDTLVRLVRQIGAGEGLYGAKITGGGSGGTVAILGHRDAGESVRRVCELYEGATNYKPFVFAGSSQGSAAFGHIVAIKER